MNDQFTLHVPADHAAFAGHFPGEPIVPGVVLLDEALYRISDTLRVAAHECAIHSAKFVSAARPGETLQLAVSRDTDQRLAFAIRAPDRLVASGVLTLPARTGVAPGSQSA
jgi:3-hydroxymyristoyl/3-hydroxydecanoyl-(acyl carrier protein) dehydratase